MSFVGFHRPNRAGYEAGFGCYVILPGHGLEGLQRLAPGLFVASCGILEGCGGKVVGGMPAIVVAHLSLPTIRVSRPMQHMDKSQPLESPVLQFTFIEGRLLEQRVRFVTNNPES